MTFYTGGAAVVRNDAGEFRFTKIVDAQSDYVEVENLPPNPANIIAVPQFENLTLGNYNCEKFLAVAVSDTLTINGEIGITDAAILNCSNSDSWDKFAAIFILAKKIVFAENARLHAGAMIIAEEIENFSGAVLTGAPNFVYN